MCYIIVMIPDNVCVLHNCYDSW